MSRKAQVAAGSRGAMRGPGRAACVLAAAACVVHDVSAFCPSAAMQVSLRTPRRAPLPALQRSVGGIGDGASTRGGYTCMMCCAPRLPRRAP